MENPKFIVSNQKEELFSTYVHKKLNSHADVFSRSIGLKFWSVFIYIHIFCMPAAKALVSLCISKIFLENTIRVSFKQF